MAQNEIQLDQSLDVVNINDDHTASEIVEDSGYSEKMVPYIYDGKKMAIPQRWYWGSICKRMIQHNKAHGYTGCILIGMSGSGKTTLTQTLLHTLHKYGENYITKWFNGEDMMRIDEVIDKLEVGFPHVIVMDDASYTLEDAPRQKVAKLANALTTIRHKVKSRVIIIFNIHYSKATKKFFRNQHFTFLTSVTTEELGNLKDLFQDKMPVIKQFGRKYRQMALLGHFYVPLSLYEGKAIKYKINEPFRLGVVSEITDLHFFVYPRERCEVCMPMVAKKQDELLDTTEKVAELLQGYKNQSALRLTLMFYCLTHNLGENKDKWLKGAYRSYWNLIYKLSQRATIDWAAVFQALEDQSVKSQKRPYKARGKHTKKTLNTLMDIMEEEKAKESAPTEEKTDKVELLDIPDDNGPTQNDSTQNNYSDYDSQYVPPKGD